MISELNCPKRLTQPARHDHYTRNAEQADTLKDMNLPKGTLVMMIVKRGDEYHSERTLKLHAGDKLLLISENSKE